MAGTLAVAGVVGAPLTSQEAQGSVNTQAPATAEELNAARSISCHSTLDKWYPLAKGDVITLKTSGAVIPADVSVDGVKQYDNDADTATVVQLKTSDNTNRYWKVTADFAGSLFVLRCGSNFGRTDTAAGREARRLDVKLGRNNPTKRINFNSVSK